MPLNIWHVFYKIVGVAYTMLTTKIGNESICLVKTQSGLKIIYIFPLLAMDKKLVHKK